MTITPQYTGQGWVPAWRLCDRLIRSLDASGVGVQGMADRLGVSRATVGRWLNDHAEPKRAMLLAWAAITGVDLHWLETGEGRPNLPGDPHEPDQLPRLDSNQQPSVYPSPQVSDLPDGVVDLAAVRYAANRWRLPVRSGNKRPNLQVIG